MTRTVVHFTDSDALGGTERVIAQLLRSIDQKQWRPILFHHDESGIAELTQEADALGVQRQVLPRMMTVRDLTKQRQFIDALKQAETEVFHAHLAWPLACKYGLVAAKRAGIPAIVATAHIRMDLTNRPLLRFQPRLIAKLVDRYLAVSNGVADQLSKSFRIPQHKVEVVPNGIDIHAYASEPNTTLQENLAGTREAPVILTVARLSEQKGHRDLIQAAAKVPRAIFLFAGDGPLLSELQQQVKHTGLSDRVRFLGHREDVPDLLAISDLFVLPSLYEGMPLSILEAMAAHVPVIATDIPGNNELIAPDKTGTLTPAQSPDALAEAINGVLNDPITARRMTDEAYEAVCQHHSLEHTASRVALAYEQLLSRKEQDSRP